MFTSLLEWLKIELSNIGAGIADIWKAFKAFFQGIWFVIMAIVGAVVAVWNFIMESLTLLLNTVNSLVIDLAQVDTSGLTSVLAGSNTFFPLQEAFSMFVTYWTLKVVIITYRFLKSWIPTLGN